MKKLIFLAVAFIFLQSIEAQWKEARIVYEMKVDMWRRIPEDNVQMRSMVPQFRSSRFELQVANNQSLYKAVEPEPDMTEDNNNGVVIRIAGGAENEYYKNFSTWQSVEKRELMGETYLITDSVRSIKWKLEDGETKTILGHPCKKASGKTERGNEVIAWYAEDMPVPAGPEQFSSLPGTILGLEANKGEMTYQAISIEPKADLKSIKAPTKGKKVDQAGFAKIQKEVLGNSPGGVRIVTN